jgi:hypothetical protein
MRDQLEKYKQTIEGLQQGDIFLKYSRNNAKPEIEEIALCKYDHTSKSNSIADTFDDEVLKGLGEIDVLVFTGIIKFERKFQLGPDKLWLPSNHHKDIYYGTQYAVPYITHRDEGLKFSGEIYAGETDIRRAMIAHGNEHNLPLVLKIIDSTWSEKPE